MCEKKWVPSGEIARRLSPRPVAPDELGEQFSYLLEYLYLPVQLYKVWFGLVYMNRGSESEGPGHSLLHPRLLRRLRLRDANGGSRN